MKYVLKKLNRIILADKVTDKHICTLNDLTNIKISNTSDVIDATGSDGAILAEFDTKKTSEITATNGAIESGAIEAQSGSPEKVVVNGTGIRIRESFTLTSSSNTSITLAHKASGMAGEEIKYIYKADSNGNPSTTAANVFSQAAEVSGTEFSYAPTTKVITLPTDAFKAGDTVIVDYYPTFSSYKEIDNDSNAFGINAKVIVDGWFTDLCTKEDVPLQFACGDGKVQGKFDFDFGDKAAVQNLDIKLASSSCANDSKNLWKMFTYDMDDIVDT